MRSVKFLLVPISYNLYLDEIIEYADSNVCVSVEDLGLKLKTVSVDCDNSYQAVKAASRKLYQENKGFNFVEVGVTW